MGGEALKIVFLDKFGAVGTFLTALSCPACWPLFASVGSALGLGFLLPYEAILMQVAFPLFVVISLLGSVLSYRYHKQILPLALGCISALLILYGFYGGWHLNLMYVGIFGILASSVLSYLAKRKQDLICQA